MIHIKYGFLKLCFSKLKQYIVLNYFNKWIEKYPHLQNLQKANISDLLKLWEGLGYYSRVQNIFKASKLLNEKYNNLIPKSYEELMVKLRC